MNRKTTSLCRTWRRLAPLTALLALAFAAPDAAAQWRIEPIAASEGVAQLQDLAFDGQGRGVLSWQALLQGRVPPAFGGLALRDPAGGWQRPPDLSRIDPATTQLHLYGTDRALLVAREGGAAGPGKRRLVASDGTSDGGFAAPVTLGTFVAGSWSAANGAGDAIVAFRGERSPFLSVAERRAGHRFGRARDLAIARSATVAINGRGDRLLAWPEGRRIAVRVRRAGAAWGRIVRFGQLGSDRDRRLSAVIAPNGRIVITWGRERGPCGVAVRSGARWRVRRLEQRCGSAAVGPRGAPVVPVVDSAGAIFVAWTHRTARANSVTVARVGAAGPVGAVVVSRQRGALLDDVAAGPDRAIAITWAAVLSSTNPLDTATYAAVRRATGGFVIERVSPAGVTVGRGSRVAFQPLTSQAVVAIPYRVGRTVAVGSAVSPRPVP
jgi:hypothetical protein